MGFWRKNKLEKEEYEIQELQSLGSNIQKKPNKELDICHDKIVQLETELTSTKNQNVNISTYNSDITNKYNNLVREFNKQQDELIELKKPKTPQYISTPRKTNSKSKISSLRKNLDKVKNEIKKTA